LEVMTRELGVMDATAISLCKDNDLPVIVLNIQRPGAVLAAARGEQVGTLISGKANS
jgi:uridylate kinase